MVANEQGADARWEGGDNKKLTMPPGGPHLLIVRGSFEKKDITSETQKLQGAVETETTGTSEVPLAEPQTPQRMQSFGRKQNSSRFLMLNQDLQTCSCIMPHLISAFQPVFDTG